MAKILKISVADKIATYLARQGDIVCGNSDYIARFTFDEEWAGKEKTARFTWNGQFEDVDLVDDECAVPLLAGVDEVKVGIYSGELSTTTAATIGCKRSIRCEQATPTVENDQRYANEAKEAADRAEAAADLSENKVKAIVTEIMEPIVEPFVEAAVGEALDDAVAEATAEAADSAETAKASEAAAQSSATEAETSKTAAADSAGAAAGSAEAAAGSATDAAGSAALAGDYATTAKDAAYEAVLNKGQAAGSALAAAAHANDALGSATAAAESAEAAAGYATNAAGSSRAAADYATDAESSAKRAANSETSASNSESSAGISRDEAADSARQASASAAAAASAAERAATEAAAAVTEAARTEVQNLLGQVGLSAALGDSDTKAVTQKTVTTSFAEAIKGTASGETVTLNDVTSLPVKVRVRVIPVGEGVRDVDMRPYRTGALSNGVSVTINAEGSITLGGAATTFGVFTLKDDSDYTLPKGKYTLSGAIDETIWLQMNAIKGNVIVDYVDDKGGGVTFDWSDLDYDGVRFLLRIEKDAVCENRVEIPGGSGAVDVIGKVLTPKLIEHTAGEEGVPVTITTNGGGTAGETINTVTGATVELDPIAPSMTITSDVTGVTLSVKYHKDVNKVIEKLVQAIINLGGSVDV